MLHEKHSPADIGCRGILYIKAKGRWSVSLSMLLVDKQSWVRTVCSPALFVSRHAGLRFVQRGHHRVEVERSRLLARRILDEVLYLARHKSLT